MEGVGISWSKDNGNLALDERYHFWPDRVDEEIESLDRIIRGTPTRYTDE